MHWLDGLGYDCSYQSNPRGISSKALQTMAATGGMPMEQARAIRRSNLSLVPISGGCWQSYYEAHKWSNVACVVRQGWERTVVAKYVVHDP